MQSSWQWRRGLYTRTDTPFRAAETDDKMGDEGGMADGEGDGSNDTQGYSE